LLVVYGLIVVVVVVVVIIIVVDVIAFLVVNKIKIRFITFAIII
jgi:hypothetical protein